MEDPKIQFVGTACGQHGSYTFYKAFKYFKDGKYKILSLGEFFFVKISKEDDVCIAELQLLWEDKNNGQVLSSSRLYFLPENTPEGRQDYHGEDEMFASSEKIILKLEDIVEWIVSGYDWKIGSLGVCDNDVKIITNDSDAELVQTFAANNCGLDVKDINKEKKLIGDTVDLDKSVVTILSYPRYCRYKASLKRVESVTDTWLKNALVTALGGFTIKSRNARILFCRDTCDHPRLANHELRCDHLAPNLKGRPRKKRLKGPNFSNGNKRSPSPESESNPESEESSHFKNRSDGRNGLKPKLEEEAREEQEFLQSLYKFMSDRLTPIERVPHLGFKQIDLFFFYTYTQKLGGYEKITARKLWKHIYDELGGNPGSTSAATCTRRHYERLLLPYERCVNSGTYKSMLTNKNCLQSPPMMKKSSDENEQKQKTKLTIIPSSVTLVPLSNTLTSNKGTDLKVHQKEWDEKKRRLPLQKRRNREDSLSDKEKKWDEIRRQNALARDRVRQLTSVNKKCTRMLKQSASNDSSNVIVLTPSSTSCTPPQTVPTTLSNSLSAENLTYLKERGIPDIKPLSSNPISHSQSFAVTSTGTGSCLDLSKANVSEANCLPIITKPHYCIKRESPQNIIKTEPEDLSCSKKVKLEEPPTAPIHIRHRNGPSIMSPLLNRKSQTLKISAPTSHSPPITHRNIINHVTTVPQLPKFSSVVKGQDVRCSVEHPRNHSCSKAPNVRMIPPTNPPIPRPSVIQHTHHSKPPTIYGPPKTHLPSNDATLRQNSQMKTSLNATVYTNKPPEAAHQQKRMYHFSNNLVSSQYFPPSPFAGTYRGFSETGSFMCDPYHELPKRPKLDSGLPLIKQNGPTNLSKGGYFVKDINGTSYSDGIVLDLSIKKKDSDILMDENVDKSIQCDRPLALQKISAKLTPLSTKNMNHEGDQLWKLQSLKNSLSLTEDNPKNMNLPLSGHVRLGESPIRTLEPSQIPTPVRTPDKACVPVPVRTPDTSLNSIPIRTLEMPRNSTPVTSSHISHSSSQPLPPSFTMSGTSVGKVHYYNDFKSTQLHDFIPPHLYSSGFSSPLINTSQHQTPIVNPDQIQASLAAYRELSRQGLLSPLSSSQYSFPPQLYSHMFRERHHPYLYSK